MSKLLINEPPLQVLPSLAQKVGLNEAIILQQIHYWLDPRMNKNVFQEKHWVHNRYEDWQKQFPFWSVVTIRRTIKELEKRQLISSRILNDRFNRSKFYTINYDALAMLTEESLSGARPSLPTDQDDHMDGSNRSPEVIKMIRRGDQNDQFIYKDTETTSETTTLSPKKRTKGNSKSTDCKETQEREMIKIWCEEVSPSVDIHLTPKRKQRLQHVFEHIFKSDVEKWRHFCHSIASSRFLMGEITAFKASLDWCSQEEKLVKILEGDYGIGDRALTFSKKEQRQTGEEGTAPETDPSEPPLLTTLKNLLRKGLGEECFQSWIRPLAWEKQEEDTLTVRARSTFVRDYINTHLLSRIQNLLTSGGEGVKSLCVVS